MGNCSKGERLARGPFEHAAFSGLTLDDKQVKWANCCTLDEGCTDCRNRGVCTAWCRYVEDHRRSKGYAHFDKRTSLANSKTRAKVLNPKWVASHGFWPLIHVTAKRHRFVGERDGTLPHLKKKTREIRYCSHIDRCILQRYAFLIDRRYNEVVDDTLIDDCAIAYRTNKGRDNIFYAKRVFDFVQRHRECLVLVTDFKDFFDSIDHNQLKRSLRNLMGFPTLPDDWYTVFKNVTCYSDWTWDDLIKIAGLTHSRSARRTMNESETIISEEQFARNASRCVRKNKSGRGIPQGSPISAVLSNVYMMDLDREIAQIVARYDGLYLRYCDDVIAVIPVNDREEKFDGALERLNQIFSRLSSCPGVSVQEEKTDRYWYSRGKGYGFVHKISSCGGTEERPVHIDYLGFTFDGTRVRLRAKAISKYHYRMRRKARSAVKQKKGRRNLYGLYSEKSWEITRKRCFVDYARRAQHDLLLDDPECEAVVKHNMEKIAKAINQLENKGR